MKFGSNTGDRVYIVSKTYGKIYPASEGYYGIITGWDPARNYNQNATYYVDVYDRDDKKVTSIRAEWYTDIHDKKMESVSDRLIDKKLSESFPEGKYVVKNDFEADDRGKMVKYKKGDKYDASQSRMHTHVALRPDGNYPDDMRGFTISVSKEEFFANFDKVS